MKFLNDALPFICIILTYITYSSALECYSCERQDGNNNKCLKNMVVCEQGEDVCMTEVKWSTMPYWQQGAQKQYYISKKCSTKQLCEKDRYRNMKNCTYIWYQDWSCTHCCQGDRCNYYVILGASSPKISMLVLGASFLVSIAWRAFAS